MVRRSNLDGTGVQDLVLAETNDVNGIALDLTNQMLYWSESANDSGSILRADLDGSNESTIVPSLTPKNKECG